MHIGEQCATDYAAALVDDADTRNLAVVALREGLVAGEEHCVLKTVVGGEEAVTLLMEILVALLVAESVDVGVGSSCTPCTSTSSASDNQITEAKLGSGGHVGEVEVCYVGNALICRSNGQTSQSSTDVTDLHEGSVGLVDELQLEGIGSFYIFYDSKESFAKTLIAETEERLMRSLMPKLTTDGTIEIKVFLDLYRDCFRPENNFLLRIKLEDWVWLKTHLAGDAFFERDGDTERLNKIMPHISGVRKDIDPGIVINFIKSIYAIYQNRETFFEESLERNVDLIFDTIYRYMKE